MTGRTGRPPLSERRRATTRMEIAEEAVRLFAAKGVAAASADEIAAAAGVSTRTLWRYFRSKEDCVRPLLTAGLDAMADRVRAWDGTGSLLAAVRRSGELSIDPRHVTALRELVVLTRTEPGLRAVWLETHYEAEVLFCRLVAESTGRCADELPLRLHVGMFNLAMRIAVEDWARRGAESPAADLEALTGAVIRTVATAARALED
ncbi:TetR family transcriptional regulator [Actinospica sp. MGRD01-02]|uniref:TetR family transcriptional regulator n=1 Tax=Actinospica acidithermotolerans TaxID=2828514 RepID=A0A941IFT3_9ACTN|nr:TetR family transcriptional regulator [Actinospica acidithermotolerans]MBR7825389.1 TetR family transcriptional regulator [Actinospica acidithermotolerans]